MVREVLCDGRWCCLIVFYFLIFGIKEEMVVVCLVWFFFLGVGFGCGLVLVLVLKEMLVLGEEYVFVWFGGMV